MQHLAPLRDDTDHTRTEVYAAANRLVLVAAACDDRQRLASRLDQQDDGVVELEELAHGAESRVVDLVELERRVDLRRGSLQHLERIESGHGGAARSEKVSFSTERTR